MTLTIEQIKAARALLKWSQKDLAHHAKLHYDQVRNFEASRSRSLETMEAIYNTFTANGLEFMPFEGIRRKPSGALRTLSGKEGLRELYDDIYDTALNHGGNIDIFNGLPNEIINNLGKQWYEAHTKRMTDIVGRYTLRAIIREGDHNFIGSDFATYKWWSSKSFQKKMIYIFGPKVGFITFEPNIEIILINQPEIAESQRALFETAWGNAEEID